MYRDMNMILNDNKVGDFSISHFVVKNDFRALISGIPQGEYVRLCNKYGDCMMSNTPMEKRTNMQFVDNAHGKVLIGGLGIGMILLAIQDKENIEKITVIEKHQDVIDLVKPQLPLNEKVEIINADIFEFTPSEKYNTIYFDIWDYINSDIYKEQMKPLISKFRKYLVKKSEDEERYINCWAKYQAQHDLRLL